MRCRERVSQVWCWCSLLLALIGALPSRVAAQTGQTPEPPASQGQEPPKQPADSPYVFEDEVFVQEKTPEIPTSNTVAAKLALPLQQTPASVSVVGAPLIEEQRAFVLGDALKNAAGLNVQSGSGVFDVFIIRGFDSIASGLILTDGAPEPETTFYQLYNVERVEVLRGPSSFLYGGSPLAGAVNLVRKQPLAGNSARVGAWFGSFGTREGTLDVNRSNAADSLSFRLNGLWQESDGYRDDKASHNRAIDPALTWRPSDRTVVNFNFEYVDTQYRSDSGLPLVTDFSQPPGSAPVFQIPDVPRTRSYQSPFDISDQEIHRFQVDAESHRSDRLVVRNKTYYRRLDWLSAGTIFNGVFPVPPTFSPLVFRTLLNLDDLQRFTGDQLEVLWRVDTGSVTHNWLFGLEAAELADEFTFDVGLLPPIGLLNPVESATRPIALVPGQSLAADAKSRILAPYAVDQITFSDKFQLLLGARYDAIGFEDKVTRTSRDDDKLSPMLGIVLSPSSTLSFYANAGEAFAPPSTLVVGQERVPEESRQAELGVKRSSRDGRLQASLALFRIERENIAIPTNTGILRQNGDQRSKGIELELGAVLGSGLKVQGSYAYIDSELTRFAESILIFNPGPSFLVLDRSGNTSPFAPKHLANFWLTKRFGNGFGAGLGGRYVSSQFIAEDNQFELGGYATADAALFYDWRRWRVQLNLKNLTDEEYFTRGFGNTSVIPAPGFNAQAGFAFRF